jgi:hypothetical protein
MMPSALTETQLINLHALAKGFCGAHHDRLQNLAWPLHREMR